MPQIKHYRVTRTSIVDVTANDEVAALTVANMAFEANDRVANTNQPFGYASFPPEVQSVEVTRR